MLRILVVVGHYLPSYKGGGALRAVANIVENLGQEFQFYILTSDRDTNEDQPYLDIKAGIWQTVGNAQVRYLSRVERSMPYWRKALMQQSFDLLYLNSFFLPQSIYTMFLHGTHRIPRVPVILAPRGELTTGALSLKYRKKQSYLTLSRYSGWYHDITWQATAEHEREAILSLFGQDVSIYFAPDLPSKLDNRTAALPFKEPGSIKIVFLSRITRKKNLAFALHVLARLSGNIEFDIYGPLEDAAYWEECQGLIQPLPQNIRVRYKEAVPHDEVQGILAQYHLFFLPTLDENFGYVILEALNAACPVLISDQTPWQDLEQHHAGWKAPLAHPELFEAVLNKIIQMDAITFEHHAQAAQQYGRKFATRSDLVATSRQLFYQAMELNRS